MAENPDDRLTRLRAILDLLPVPAHLVEPGGAGVLFANRAAVGVPVGGDAREASLAVDARGESIPPEDRPDRRAGRGETFAGVEITFTGPDGPATYLASAAAVPPEPGCPPLALLTWVEVTATRAAREELERALVARDEFFSFATHELKDPLSSLLLSIEVLKRMAERQGTVPVGVLLERLEVSRRQGKRLASMIENLLDVSRISSGRVQPDVEAFDLCTLVHDVVGRFREPAREAGVALTVEPCDPMIGYFDRMQLDHVIGNLISNALKYGEGRPVVVRLVGDEETAVIEVEDHGIGIAESDQGRVFERFERASRGHRAKSLGLGLFIVRTLVEAHGGSIALRSEPGRGSTFTVRLPRKRLPGHDGPTTSPN